MPLKRRQYTSAQLSRASPGEKKAMNKINKKIEARHAKLAVRVKEYKKNYGKSGVCSIQGGRRRRTRRRKSSRKKKRTRRRRKSHKQSKRKRR